MVLYPQQCRFRTLLAGKSIGNDSEVEGEEDEENEEEDDKSTGRGRGAPPSYGELSSHFGILELSLIHI